MNETMEVMSNEMDEVICVAESITPKTGKGLKVAGGTAIALAVGYGVYKGAKWIGGKLKAKKVKEETPETEETPDENTADENVK